MKRMRRAGCVGVLLALLLCLRYSSSEESLSEGTTTTAEELTPNPNSDVPQIQEQVDAAETPRKYLVGGTLFRDEAEYLDEWLAYHKMLGFDKIVLYNDHSQDNYREVAQPYIDEGFVELINWPEDAAKFYDDRKWLSMGREDFEELLNKCALRAHKWHMKKRRLELEAKARANPRRKRKKETPEPAHHQRFCQFAAFTDLYARHRDYTWVTAFDIDEFFVPMNVSLPIEQAIPLSLKQYEDRGCEYVHFDSIPFGSNWHEQSPPGLTIENYVRRGPLRVIPPGLTDWSGFKVACKPTYCAYSEVHVATTDPNLRAKEKYCPVQQEDEVLRMHHYKWKSKEDSLKKMQKNANPEYQQAEDKDFEALMNSEMDDSIVRFVPKLREVLQEVATKREQERPKKKKNKKKNKKPKDEL